MRQCILWLLVLILLFCPTLYALALTDAQITQGVLNCFEQLAAVPRPSHHEEKIGAFLLDWAKNRGYAAYQDAVGNVIFDIPATQGCEGAPIVALQAHMDMVAVSDDPTFDPVHTPIQTVRNGNTLCAVGTSLGADDGIGVATILYLASSETAHGPLRAIITVNEEDGMTGIFAMDAGVVADVSYLINLDAETIGEAIISTAAGAILNATQTPSRVAPTLDTALIVRLDGLQGGHSGVMIDKGRANAIQHMADFLLTLRERNVNYELASFVGGMAPNAIPNQAEALIVIAAQDELRVTEIAAERGQALADAYAASDADLTLTATAAQLPATVFEQEQAADIIDFASLVLDGIHTMSQSVNGLVESSSNLGILCADADEVSITLNERSSHLAQMESICLKQQRLAERLGFETTIINNADPWPVNTHSELQVIMQEVYHEQTGQALKLTAVHAGLECGTFARLKPGLDMIAVGPNLKDVHTVHETLYIDSIAPFFRLVEGTLQRIAE